MHPDLAEGAQAEPAGVLVEAIGFQPGAVDPADGGQFPRVDFVRLVLAQGVGGPHQSFGQKRVEHIDRMTGPGESAGPRQVIAAG